MNDFLILKDIALDICDTCGSPYVASHSELIENTINQYAKQECMSFIKWANTLYIRYNAIENGGESIWHSRISKEKLTDEQLYELYLQSKNK